MVLGTEFYETRDRSAGSMKVKKKNFSKYNFITQVLIFLKGMPELSKTFNTFLIYIRSANSESQNMEYRSLVLKNLEPIYSEIFGTKMIFF